MSSVAERVRTIEVAERKLSAQDQRLAELQQGRQTTADAVAVARRDLVLALAMERGLLDLPAAEIVAAFQRLEVPTSPSQGAARSPSADSIQAVSGLQLGLDQLADITVNYTSYKRGDRVMLLQEIGLKRGGPRGFWHGRVDAAQLDRLVTAFPGKVSAAAAGSESTSAVDSATDQSMAVSETSIEAIEEAVDAPPPATERTVSPEASMPKAVAPADSVVQATAQPAPPPASPSTQLPRAPFSWPRRVSSGGAGSDGEKAQ